MLQGCADEKAPLTDNFEFLANTVGKADFSDEMNVVHSASLPAKFSIAHTGESRYSAISFAGVKNDTIKLSVRSNDADPVAWLLDSNFKILAQNDDSDESLNSYIQIKLAKEGKYYLAFRDYFAEAGTFSVHLKGKTPTPTPTPTPPPSVVDENSCTGPTMTFEEGLQYFDAGQATSRTLAPYSFYAYKRSCTPNTGCTEWQELDDKFFETRTGGYTRSDFESVLKLTIPEANVLKLEGERKRVAHLRQSNPIQPEGPLYTLLESHQITPRSDMSNIFSYPYVRLSGRITNHCVRLASNRQKKIRNSSAYNEYRLVLFAQF